MRKRKLGNTGLEVSAIGLGWMGMSMSYGQPMDTGEMTALTYAAGRRAGQNDGVAVRDTLAGHPPPRAVMRSPSA